MQLSYSLSLPTDARHVSVVRRLCVGTLTELEVDQDSIDDVALAVTEACANVVQHGAGAGDFEVTVALDGATCSITVRETGGSFTGAILLDDTGDDAPATDVPGADGSEPDLGPDPDDDPDPLTHGRGISLMRLLVDDLRYVPDDSGTTVVLTKRLDLRGGSVLAAD